eukprot:scaffold164840_cov32-Tisochrysis_lutea.AAC.3
MLERGTRADTAEGSALTREPMVSWQGCGPCATDIASRLAAIGELAAARWASCAHLAPAVNWPVCCCHFSACPSSARRRAGGTAWISFRSASASGEALEPGEALLVALLHGEECGCRTEELSGGFYLAQLKQLDDHLLVQVVKGEQSARLGGEETRAGSKLRLGSRALRARK